MSTHCFVNASHADNHLNRQSQTGILIFVNSALIIWFSKRQNTIETSTFGSEMVTLRIAVEQIQAVEVGEIYRRQTDGENTIEKYWRFKMPMQRSLFVANLRH